MSALQRLRDNGTEPRPTPEQVPIREPQHDETEPSELRITAPVFPKRVTVVGPSIQLEHQPAIDHEIHPADLVHMDLAGHVIMAVQAKLYAGDRLEHGLRCRIGEGQNVGRASGSRTGTCDATQLGRRQAARAQRGVDDGHGLRCRQADGAVV